MEVFTVGGSIRNEIMGINNDGDIDYVIVGATESDIDSLIDKGYEKVGKSFPVFLYQGNEYAIARTEVSTGPSYSDFECVFDENVTLEDDLYRRDFTMNAIAKNQKGEYIDPYGGMIDIDKKIIRHVSDHFREDPLRVLRLARFAAIFPDFSIANDTIQICKEMVKDGMLYYLPYERVIGEMYKTIERKGDLVKFKNVILETGADAVLFSKLDHNVFRDKTFDHAARLSVDNPDVILAAIFSNVDSSKMELYRFKKDVIRFISVFNSYYAALEAYTQAKGSFSIIGKNHIPVHQLSGILPSAFERVPRIRPKHSRTESNRMLVNENTKIWNAALLIDGFLKNILKAPIYKLKFFMILTTIAKCRIATDHLKYPYLFRADDFENVCVKAAKQIHHSKTLIDIARSDEIEGRVKGAMLTEERLSIIRKEMYEWKTQPEKR